MSTIDAEGLRAMQQPLKDAYRQDPAGALITLRARGELGEENISCSVETGRAMAVAGLHPATGGDGTLACSGDMLLQALVACAGTERFGKDPVELRQGDRRALAGQPAQPEQVREGALRPAVERPHPDPRHRAPGGQPVVHLLPQRRKLG